MRTKVGNGDKARIIAFYGNHPHKTIIVIRRDGIPNEMFVTAAKTIGEITYNSDIIEIVSSDKTEYFAAETPEEYKERMVKFFDAAFPFVPKIKVVHESLAGFTGD